LNINVKNKRILITASSRGIGWGIAKVFLHEGAYVFMCARHLEDLRDVKENWENAYIYYCDLTDQSSLEVLINSIIKEKGGIDVFIHNTGNPDNEPSTFFELQDSDWDYSIKLYLLSAIKIIKLIYKYMISNGFGRIVFISSYTVKEPSVYLSLADVSRAGIIQLTKVLSRELGKYGITVNTILLGSFETPGAKRTITKLAKRLGVDFKKVWEEEVIAPTSVKRIGIVEKDLAPLLVFLSSEYSSYITGSIITVDGGVMRTY